MSEDKKQADRYEEIGLDEYGREDPCPPAYREEIDTLRARVTKLKRDAAKLCELEQIRSAERNHALDQRDTLAARVAELEQQLAEARDDAETLRPLVTDYEGAIAALKADLAHVIELEAENERLRKPDPHCGACDKTGADICGRYGDTDAIIDGDIPGRPDDE